MTHQEIFLISLEQSQKPGPVATTYNDGKEIKINKAVFINDAPKYIATVGQVLSKTNKGFLIKTYDSFIEILEN